MSKKEASAEEIANAAIDDFEEGRFDRALERIRMARAIFEARPGSARQRRDVATSHQLEAQIWLGKGSLELAMNSYSLAEATWEVDPENEKLLGRCLFDIAVTLSDYDAMDLALEYVVRADSVLRRSGEDTGEAERFIADLRSLKHSGQERELNMRSRIESAHSGWDEASTSYTLAVELVEREESVLIPEVLYHLQVAEEWVREHEGVERYITTLMPLVSLALRDWRGYDPAQLPAWVDAAARTVLERASGTDSLGTIASANEICAAVNFIRGDDARSLDHASRAIAAYDVIQMGTESSAIRSMLSFHTESARAIALRVACRTGDVALALELIETGRLQVLPDFTTASAVRSVGRLFQIASSGGRRRVGGLRPVAVGGRSRLAPYYSAGMLGPELSLEESMRLVAGTAGWWWATWAFQRMQYWALMTPEGPLACGELDISDDTSAGRVIRLALESGGLAPPEVDPADAPFSRGYAEEEALSIELGSHVIPALLRDELLRRKALGARREWPLSLAVSSNVLHELPLPLLGIEPMSPDRHATRLIETAILRTACPAVLTDHIAKHPSPSGTRYPTTVACINPTGDLEYTEEAPPQTETVLSRSQATKRKLRKALASAGPSAPALFYYSGHAAEGAGRGDVDSALVMADDFLSANDIFVVGADARPAYQFPARAQLSACSSAGSTGTGAGEWLGISAAVLWAGARQVVATIWPIWDTPFTQRLDKKIAVRLNDCQDVGAEPRCIQIACLREWRNGGDDNPALPLIWAAYQSLGLMT